MIFTAEVIVGIIAIILAIPVTVAVFIQCLRRKKRGVHPAY